jgi:hypothetical protein
MKGAGYMIVDLIRHEGVVMGIEWCSVGKGAFVAFWVVKFVLGVRD